MMSCLTTNRRTSKHAIFGVLAAAMFIGTTGLLGFSSAHAASLAPVETVWWNPMTWFSSSSPVAASAVAHPVAQPKLHRRPVETIANKSVDVLLPPGYGAVMETQRGRVVIELYPQDAPITVANFIQLVEKGFYNVRGMTFHRVVPGFVAQTGDPTATGSGGSGKKIPLEVKNKLSHDDIGVVAMARTAAPDSATSQFYITLAPAKFLDGKYAVFGRVIQGLDVLPKIQKGDRVYGIKVEDIRDAKAQAKVDARANGSFGKKIKKWL